MNITLPIPIQYDGATLSDCAIKGYTAGLLADTKKAIMADNAYKAYMVFLAGCIDRIGAYEDKQKIREIVRVMSYRTAEYLTVKILSLDDEDDGIEGMYTCPRCGKKIICEKTADGDTRDFIKDMPCTMLQDGEAFIVQLKNAIEVQNKAEDDSIDSVSSLEFRYPTLSDCSNAFIKYGKKDETRLQLAIYLEALTKVNGYPVPEKFKSRYGMQVLEDFTRADIQALGAKINQYGLENKVTKTCPDCQKEFEVYINTANFFASALR